MMEPRFARAKTVGILKYVIVAGNKTVDKRGGGGLSHVAIERATLGPYQHDYAESSDLDVNLLLQIERVALEIVDTFWRREQVLESSQVSALG